jgi:hypothetical protein
MDEVKLIHGHEKCSLRVAMKRTDFKRADSPPLDLSQAKVSISPFRT